MICVFKRAKTPERYIGAYLYLKCRSVRGQSSLGQLDLFEDLPCDFKFLYF